MHSAHANEPRTYAKVLLVLLAFTVTTVLVSGLNFGSPSANVVIAMAIATAKASLVALFFMHLRHEKPMNSIIFVAGVSFLALFLVFSSIDVASREVIRPSFNSQAVKPSPVK
jgi:cytochrome c oxidase subunit 4